MHINKIIGYGLLVSGILLIAVPLYQTYAIFTGSSLPPQVFKTVEPPSQPAANNPFDIQAQVQKGVMAVLPLELIHNTLNLAGWMILMLILIFGGKQIADIGIKVIGIKIAE